MALCLGGSLVTPLAAATGSGRSFPAEAKRLLDPATEFPIIRLTSPEHNSNLPSYSSRFIHKKATFLLFTSDRTGANGLYRIELKGGEITQLAEGEAIEPRFVALSPDDRFCFYADGDRLLQAPVQASQTAKARELYRTGEGWRRAGVPAVTEDGIGALVAEMKDGAYRLRFVSFARGQGVTIAESPEPVEEILPRPRRAAAAFRRGREIWLANYDGQQKYKLRTGVPAGSVQWTADGRSLLYLSRPEAPALSEIREFAPDTNEDKLVAKTSQFAAFGRNADATVFVGASGSKASPYLFLLVRAVSRELAIAEHKAGDPAASAPVFSPNSQRVFYETDRDGRRCIYGMTVDKLVEATEP